MKLLVAYDGSEIANGAINDLRCAGLPEKGEAVIITVADIWPHMSQIFKYQGIDPAGLEFSPAELQAAKELGDREAKHAREIATRGAELLRDVLPAWSISVEVSGDSPQSAIITKADQWKADLIVIGSHGRSAAGRLFLGSVSQAVLTHAHCSVRIGRRHVMPSRPLRLVIGMDGSEGSRYALSTVASRLWPSGSEAKVVAVLDPIAPISLPVAAFEGWPSSVVADTRQWISKQVERSAGELRENGLLVSPLIVEGDPKKALIAEAEQFDADCIFVGAKGLSRLERFLIGSVSTAVAARAHCSVEVIRRVK